MGAYSNVRVLVTGHTGFKGSWLCAWLKRESAIVAGLALPPPDDSPSLFEGARIADGMQSNIGDIRDAELVQQAVEAFHPEIIFHLAAQPLVRRSYREPIETYATNVMGTLHVLEAARSCPSVRAVVCVTTDKVYDNREWPWGYRETDRLGGKDPYSSSKACAELVAASYMQTMLPAAGNVFLATARGGNVVGGGDWSEDRLVPDIVQALEAGKQIILRNPASIRPWQHVLELVHAYLQLGEQLLSGNEKARGSWNFGPDLGNEVTVGELVTAMLSRWRGNATSVTIEPSPLVETSILRLDISKAMQQLQWRPVLDFSRTIELTADWYRRRHDGERPSALVDEQISLYQELRRP